MSNLHEDFQDLSGLGDIAEDYDAILCDIWGVVHNGKTPNMAACEALERFREERGPVVMISNSPQPSVAIPHSFARIGVPGGFWDAIVTSGDATIDELARRAPGPAFKLGPERDDALYDGLELNFSDLDEAEFISCTGPFDDDETPDDYRELLGHAIKRDLEFICVNPDVKVRIGDKVVYCGGALAQLYEKMGGRVVYSGKPHDPIYRLSRAWLEEVLGTLPEVERVLCIGDNIFTDLLGAQEQGYDCLFIQDGLYGDTTEKFKALLQKHKITARYMTPKLSW
ncbi:HAD superfamily hydrolase (TIGR01459 family) [Litorimonas taeanensis]|uniref:HAD superfamily hydrolase (TIGR01459 family) n=1 Tax=Litorimonas taeanensis TaxID=568099 RepID=A0A420WEY7_9PROT|nr:TIGR01459 family HAD-type hydrolase [Litorimonas taeanensis]RKQ69541.1 HAD superfamily hydrolase (TIGR01459 family) [Litorimonas taeanensis]